MEPYVLAIASHKGGTGRTTTALMLAWLLGQYGRTVTLVDADEQRSATIVASDARGHVDWQGVELRTGPDALFEPIATDLVIIDPPSLTSPSAGAILRRAHGLILTCMADPLSIRTVPAAASVIEQVRGGAHQPDLLGILIAQYDRHNLVQNAMFSRLQEAHRELLLEPAIPYQANLRSWALHPGSPPPAGPALDALGELAQSLSESLAISH